MYACLHNYLIDLNGSVIDKNKPDVSIHRSLNTTSDWRIAPNNNQNTLGYPTLKTYLEREASSGRLFAKVGVNFVITNTLSSDGFDYIFDINLS